MLKFRHSSIPAVTILTCVLRVSKTTSNFGKYLMKFQRTLCNWHVHLLPNKAANPRTDESVRCDEDPQTVLQKMLCLSTFHLSAACTLRLCLCIPSPAVGETQELF